MESKSKFKRHGQFNLKVIRDGKVIKDTGWIPNLLVNAGFPIMATLFYGSGTGFTYLAVGDSSTAVAANQTGLSSEITDSGLARATATTSQTTTTVTNDTSQLTKTWSVTNTKTVREIGVFNASSGVTMAARALTGDISLVNGDQLVGTYKISHADDGV